MNESEEIRRMHAKHVEFIESQVRSYVFIYKSADAPTKASKRLKKVFNELPRAKPITTGKARAYVAHLAGYKSWELLLDSVDPKSVDAIDHQLDERELNIRREILAHRLQKVASIHYAEAEHIIALSEPTGTCSGMLRWNGEEAYFQLDALPETQNGWSAVEAIGSNYPDCRKPLCLETDYFSTYQEISKVRVSNTLYGTKIFLNLSGIDYLEVVYRRNMRVGLKLEFDDSGYPGTEFDFKTHPSPLRPDVAESLDVSYELDSVTINDGPHLDKAYECAAAFIAFDLIRSTCLVLESVPFKFDNLDIGVDTNFDNEEMTILANLIADMYTVVLDYEQTIPIIESILDQKRLPLCLFANFPEEIGLTDV